MNITMNYDDYISVQCYRHTNHSGLEHVQMSLAKYKTFKLNMNNSERKGLLKTRKGLLLRVRLSKVHSVDTFCDCACSSSCACAKYAPDLIAKELTKEPLAKFDLSEICILKK